MNLDQFANLSKKRTETFQKKSSDLMFDLVYQAGSNVIFANPVDTGWSRSNWFTSVDLDDTGKLDGIRFTNKFEALSGATAKGISNVIDGMAGYAVKEGSIYLINNVDYVPDLNSSNKSYGGFIERQIESAKQQILSKNNKLL